MVDGVFTKIEPHFQFLSYSNFVQYLLKTMGYPCTNRISRNYFWDVFDSETIEIITKEIYAVGHEIQVGISLVREIKRRDTFQFVQQSSSKTSCIYIVQRNFQTKIKKPPSHRSLGQEIFKLTVCFRDGKIKPITNSRRF